MTAVLTTLLNFNSTDGADPLGSLLIDANGDLFGTTDEGGSSNVGTVFELVNNKGTYTLNTLVNFNGNNGSYPQAGLIADANGDLFSTTEGGSTDGTVFELVNNNGTYTLNTLVNFTGGNGANPKAGLIADGNGNLFGTTFEGGISNNGTVFELVNNNGTYTLNTLFKFSGNNGSAPVPGLIADANGDLFGTTMQGGPNNDGTVFELVNNNGTYTLNTLVNFTGSGNVNANGADPVGGLIADANGDLFGTTELGGSYNDGTVFELVNNNGTYTLNTLFNFNGGNGADSVGGLIADANGDLFGTTMQGGPNNDGTVFELVNNNGTYTLNTLVNFNGGNGQAPEASLIADGNGNLFGTTVQGGPNNDGTVFEITNSGFVTLDHWANANGGNWSSAANWNTGVVPTAGRIADIDASGTYSVAITTNDVAYGLWVNDAQATVSDSTKGLLTLAGPGGAANPNGSLNIDAGTFVLNGGTLKGGTIFIDSGGTFLISKGSYTGSNALSETITNNGSLIDNTTATITGNISGTGSLVIAGKGLLELGGADSENVTFASGSVGTFKVDHSLTAPFTGTIFGLTPKDKIDLTDLTYVSGQTKASYDPSTGKLTITNGIQPAVVLKLSGNYTNATWVLSKDATGGTIVVDPPLNPSPPTPPTSPPGLDHVVALFSQSIAAGFSDQQQHGALNTNPLSQIVTNQEQFLANPHHG
jgi:uncharacterized repeat protein (TIGR03803 family)